MFWGGRRKEGQTMAQWQRLTSWYLRSIAIYMFNVPFNPCNNLILYFSKTNEGGKKIMNTNTSSKSHTWVWIHLSQDETIWVSLMGTICVVSLIKLSLLESVWSHCNAIPQKSSLKSAIFLHLLRGIFKYRHLGMDKVFMDISSFGSLLDVFFFLFFFFLVRFFVCFVLILFFWLIAFVWVFCLLFLNFNEHWWHWNTLTC